MDWLFSKGHEKGKNGKLLEKCQLKPGEGLGTRLEMKMGLKMKVLSTNIWDDTLGQQHRSMSFTEVNF